MVSSKRTGGAIDGFIEGRQRGREQGTPHAQRDMHGISPAICRREGVASIYFFPNQIFFWTGQSKWRGMSPLRNPEKPKSSATRATSESTNSTVTKQAEQQQERDIAAREAALEHLGIKHADKASRALSCPSALWSSWRPPLVFHFTSRRPILGSPKRSTSWMARTSPPRHCGRQGVWAVATKKGLELRRAIGTKWARRTRTTPGTARTMGRSRRMLPTFNPLTGSKQSRRR